jgi:hypothetical protein
MPARHVPLIVLSTLFVFSIIRIGYITTEVSSMHGAVEELKSLSFKKVTIDGKMTVLQLPECDSGIYQFEDEGILLRVHTPSETVSARQTLAIAFPGHSSLEERESSFKGHELVFFRDFEGRGGQEVGVGQRVSSSSEVGKALGVLSEERTPNIYGNRDEKDLTPKSVDKSPVDAVTDNGDVVCADGLTPKFSDLE